MRHVSRDNLRCVYGTLPDVVEDWDGIWRWFEQSEEDWTREYSIRRYNYRTLLGDICLPLVSEAPR